ncbi:MAG TPA: tetratricopeptide repeat protein [Allosphingosinicella sp.]|jgi:predicted Zn-dependent protease
MLMDAIISGSLGQALYRKGDEVWVLESTGLEPRTAEPADLSAFHHIAREIALGDPAGLPVSPDRLRSRLDEEVAFFQGLDGLLVGMDGDFSASARSRAIRNAERILGGDPAVATRIRARFLIPANSQEWDVDGALDLANSLGAKLASAAYRPLADGTVNRISDDLAELVLTNFGVGAEAHARREGLIRSGLIAKLCGDAGNRTALLGLPFQTQAIPEVDKLDPGRKILTALVKRLAGTAASKNGKAEDLTADGPIFSAERDPLALAIYRAMEQFERKRIGSRREYDLEAIQREIAWISDRLHRGELGRAESGLIHLIDDQARRSRPEHILKTLTAVADRARIVRQFDFAGRILRAADLLEAGDSAVMCVRAEMLRDLGRPEEALTVFRETMDRFPNNAVAPNAYAETLRELGRTEEALAMFRQTMDRFPDNVVAPTAYAETLRELGRPEDALAVLRQTMDRFPDNAFAPTAYAETLRELRRPDEALAVFRQTMDRFPDNAVAPTAYAETLRELGRTNEALAMFRQTVDRFPDNAVAPNAYAETLRELGRPDEALAMFRQTMDRFPNDVVTPNAYAETLRELGRTDEALAMFRQTMDRFPNDAVAPNAYAETLRELGRTDEALAMFGKTMNRFPNNAVTPNAYAETLRELGRTNEALAIFRQTMDRFPNDSVTANAYAETLRELGRTDEALVMFQKTMRRFPNDAVAPNAYAETLRELGRTEEALAMFRQTMDRFPDNVVASTAYAETLRELGRTDEALAIFRQTMDRFPNDAVASTAYAETLRDIGRTDEALVVFRETMERFPGESVTRNACAHLLLALGNSPGAEALLSKYVERLEVRGDWIALHILAMGHLRQKSTAIAVKLLRRGRTECPFRDVKRYFNSALAVALIMDNKAKEALVELAPVIADPAARSQKVTSFLVKAHALGECGEAEAVENEIYGISGDFVLTPTQRHLAEAILATYVNCTHDSRARAAANDNIYRLELELMAKVVSPTTSAFRVAA